MPLRQTKLLPSPQGVAGGSTAIINFPLNATYYGVLLTFGGGGTGLTVARMNSIRLKINGREIFNISGADLDIANKFLGLAGATSSTLYIPFERVKLKTRDSVELTAIGTGAPYDGNPQSPSYNPTPATVMQLEIDIDATATTPTLSAKAIQTDPAPLGLLIKRRKFIYTPTGAGTFEISDLPKGDFIDRIFLKYSAALLDVKFERENYLIYERTNAENNVIQSDGVRFPQTNWHVIDPSEVGNGGDYYSTIAADMRLKLNMSGAATVTAYVDYLGGLQGN